MSWASSTRRARLPKDWARRRAAVLKRDPLCKAQGCTAPSTECDHVQNNDDHSMTNLQGLCHDCHKKKTDKEKNTARWTPNKRTQRPNESHPGLER